ncbi:hypothetical protein ABG067_000456 [Albugo candida]
MDVHAIHYVAHEYDDGRGVVYDVYHYDHVDTLRYVKLVVVDSLVVDNVAYSGVIGPVTAVYGVTQLPRIGIVTVVGWFQSVI